MDSCRLCCCPCGQKTPSWSVRQGWQRLLHLTLAESRSAGETWKQQVVGFLHDAEEDTHHDVDTVLRMVKQLLQKWSEHPEDKSWMDIFKGHDIPPCSDDAIVFPTDDDWKEIADALRFLNHHTEPVREKYIQRFGGNILALQVKVKDMENNMDISRISHPTAKDYERLERYKVEYEMLKKMLSEYEGKG